MDSPLLCPFLVPNDEPFCPNWEDQNRKLKSKRRKPWSLNWRMGSARVNRWRGNLEERDDVIWAFWVREIPCQEFKNGGISVELETSDWGKELEFLLFTWKLKAVTHGFRIYILVFYLGTWLNPSAIHWRWWFVLISQVTKFNLTLDMHTSLCKRCVEGQFPISPLKTFFNGITKI